MNLLIYRGSTLLYQIDFVHNLLHFFNAEDLCIGLLELLEDLFLRFDYAASLENHTVGIHPEAFIAACLRKAVVFAK